MDVIVKPPADAVRRFQTMSKDALLAAWSKQIDPNAIPTRDALLEAMRQKDVYPSTWSRERESTAGLYPDTADPEFAARLLSKTEFSDLRSQAVQEDICTAAAAAFDTTPVQRLVARFLHPSTPYRSLLLDHGVGVGKTCSAITVAEMFLELLPSNKVTILCPQAIAGGFRRTIFDADRIHPLPSRIAQLRGEGWESSQCTGMTYLRLAGTTMETDRSVIEKEADQLIRGRYRIMGYLQFANWITKKLAELPKTLTGKAREDAEQARLHALFSDHLLIIDEAHNLRDIDAGTTVGAVGAVGAVVTSEETEDDDVAAEAAATESPVAGAASDAAEGKKLTPVLRKILKVVEGLRLMLMTATPMYNTAPEIIFLLNILLLNDTKDETQLLRPRDFFGEGGLLESAKPILSRICTRYISYMRGENPASFPLRLTPPEAAGSSLFADYPTKSISRSEGTVAWSSQAKRIASMLPLCVQRPDIKRTAVGRVLYKLLGASRGELAGTHGNDEGSEVSDFILDQATQIANITYPDGSFGSRGWDTYWREVPGRLRQFVWDAPEDDDWTPELDEVFGRQHLAGYSPKAAAIVESLTRAKGICFVFSRYVKAGALPIAAALERAGWTRVLADGSPAPILRVPGQTVPRACAFCSNNEHGRHEGHAFAQANYVLLTGDDGLTPDFKGTLRSVNTLRTDFEIRGGRVKAIIGSQITSEGLDLKCVRENHIMDAWYHLNRIEQVIGRAVRYCSHAALPKAEQNCLIYMHAVAIPEYETADLYAYRLACKKSIPIGQVQRVIKTSAWDCLMNRDAIALKGLSKRRVVDAQGRVYGHYNPSDKPYTSICDFQESCEYACHEGLGGLNAEQVSMAAAANTSTYRPEDARRRFLEKQKLLRRYFRDEVALSIPQIQLIYADIPWDVATLGIRELLDNPRFLVERKDGTRGTLHLQHGYIVFQPLGVSDKDIPMSLRFGRAFGRLPRFMELSRTSLFESERRGVEEVAASNAAAVSATATAALAATAPAAAERIVAPDVLYTEAMQSLSEWEEHVRDRIFPTAMKVAVVPPAGIPAGAFYKAWRWIFHSFQELDSTFAIAQRWWTDNEWSLLQREAVLRRFVVQGPVEGAAHLFRPVEYFTGAMKGYHVINVEKNSVVAYCFFEGDMEPSVCPSNLMRDVQAIVGPPVDRSADTGPLFGIMVYDKKAGNAIMKTINKEDGSWKGLQCANTSNLTGNQNRVRTIQQQIRSQVKEDHPIQALLLDDSIATAPTDEQIRKHKKEDVITHLHDLNKNQLCSYMEFLLRWMDHQRVGGKRWFLSMVDTMRAGWKTE